jgi:hypothetical protein
MHGVRECVGRDTGDACDEPTRAHTDTQTRRSSAGAYAAVGVVSPTVFGVVELNARPAGNLDDICPAAG